LQTAAAAATWALNSCSSDAQPTPLYCCTVQVEKIIPKAGQPEYKYYLFSHIDFDIKYNADRVIEINVLADPQQAVDISEDTRSVKVRICLLFVCCDLSAVAQSVEGIALGGIGVL
jgi:hypothetical protein